MKVTFIGRQSVQSSVVEKSLPTSPPDNPDLLITDAGASYDPDTWRAVIRVAEAPSLLDRIEGFVSHPGMGWAKLASDAVSSQLPQLGQVVVKGVWITVGTAKAGFELRDALEARMNGTAEPGDVLIATLKVGGQIAAAGKLASSLADRPELESVAGNIGILVKGTAIGLEGGSTGEFLARVELAKTDQAVALAWDAMDLTMAALSDDEETADFQLGDVTKAASGLADPDG